MEVKFKHTLRYDRKPSSRLALYGLLLVAALTLMLCVRTCSMPTLRVAERHPSGGDTLDVAIEYGPLSLYRYDDTLGGFSYDLLRQLASERGLHLKFHPVVALGDALSGLDEGLFDIVVGAMPMTERYRERYAFTAPVYIDRQVLVQLRDSAGKAPIGSQLDMAGHEVWVMAQSPVADRLHNLASEIGDTIYVVEDPAYGSEQLFIMTATGEIPSAVVNERIARVMAADYPQVDISTAGSFNQFQSWLCRKADSLLVNRLDTIMEAHRQTGGYRELSRRYFP